MVVFEIRIRGAQEFVVKMNRLQTRYPQAGRNGMRNWGKDLERFMKLSTKSHDFDGTLTNSIQWRQTPRGNIGNLFMVQHGIFLDRMRTHFVNHIRPNSKLGRWTLEHLGFVPRELKVRKHPFIDRILNKHRLKVGTYVQRELKKELRKK